MLTSMTEQVGEGIAVTDLDGNLTFANKAWATLHGYESLVHQIIISRMHISLNVLMESSTLEHRVTDAHLDLIYNMRMNQ